MTFKGVNPTLCRQFDNLERDHQQRLLDLKAHKEYQLDLIRKQKDIESEELKRHFDVRSYIVSTNLAECQTTN